MLNSPTHSRGRKKNKISNRTEIGIIRKKIYQYYMDEKESPTISTLLRILEKDCYICDRDYFIELLDKMGFGYVRCQSPSRRHFLSERHDLGYKRIKYIEQIRECRALKRFIYFLHETYMDSGDLVRNAGRYLRVELPAKIGKNERLVIVHFGGDDGLANGKFKTIKSETESGDHFADVNLPKFEKWVNENLKEVLQPKSVIVVCSASHHSIQIDKRPKDMFASKTDIQGWLTRHNLKYDDNMLKAELLQIASKARIKPVYAFDEVLKALGHDVLRMPPQHPELNPLEFVWVDIKNKMAKDIANGTVSEKRKMWERLYLEYPGEDWEKWADQVKNRENEYFQYIDKLDDIIDDVIVRYEKDPNSDSETCETDPDQRSLSAESMSE